MRQVCNLGGGVASTAMFLMALHGDIDAKVDAAIWADTGWEPRSTHETIHKLTEYANKFGVSVYTVKATLGNGDIRNAMLDPNSQNGQMPMFTRNKQGKVMMLHRFCTNEFKVYPIRRLLRSEFKASHDNPVCTWLGYTVEEVKRIKESDVKYQILRHPLAENRIYRYDCLEYLKNVGFEFVQRSACVGCPYRKDDEFNILSDTEKQELEVFENKLNETGYQMRQGSDERLEVRLHRSMKPISEHPYKTDSTASQLTLFDDVCDGGSCWT